MGTMVKGILRETVRKLGTTGSIVQIKGGYFRYLFRSQRISYASPEALKEVEDNRTLLEARDAQRQTQAEAWYGQWNNQTIKMPREAAEKGMLYGSIAARDVAQVLKEKGVHVHPNQVLLAKPIKELGEYTVRIELHPMVTMEISLAVTAVTL